MKKKTHGLKGKGGYRSIGHTDVRSKIHEQDRARFQKKNLAIRAWSGGEQVPALPLPRFVAPGSMKTPGRLAWTAELKSIEGGELTGMLSQFESRVKAAGGPQRKGRVYKGKQYYQPSNASPLTRCSIVVPPWFSKAWADMKPAQRETGKELLVRALNKLVRERWSGVDIKGYSLHDDTGNLHVDVWASEFKETMVTVRGRDECRYVHAGAMTTGYVGPGTVYLQARVDLGAKLHPVDQAKLDQALANYEGSRKQVSSKELPEVPEGISFNRKWEAALTRLFKDPATPALKKEQYIEFCKLLDDSKYQSYNKLAVAEEKMYQLEEKEASLEDKETKLGDKETRLAQVLEEAEELCQKASEAVDRSFSESPLNEEFKKLYSNEKEIRRLFAEKPQAGSSLYMKARFSKDAYWSMFCKFAGKEINKSVRDPFGIE
jgi:hypothetical protein